MNDQVLTIAELAERLHRSVRWIEQRLADGTFPIPRLQSFDSGCRRARLWSRVDVDRFLEKDATTLRLRRSMRMKEPA